MDLETTGPFPQDWSNPAIVEQQETTGDGVKETWQREMEACLVLRHRAADIRITSSHPELFGQTLIARKLDPGEDEIGSWLIRRRLTVTLRFHRSA
jgi:hypothetical protein